jgi:hypothetical protein
MVNRIFISANVSSMILSQDICSTATGGRQIENNLLSQTSKNVWSNMFITDEDGYPFNCFAGEFK